VLQSRRRLQFAKCAGTPFWGVELDVEQFDHDLTVERRIAGAVNSSEPAGGDDTENVVPADASRRHAPRL